MKCPGSIVISSGTLILVRADDPIIIVASIRPIIRHLPPIVVSLDMFHLIKLRNRIVIIVTIGPNRVVIVEAVTSLCGVSTWISPKAGPQHRVIEEIQIFVSVRRRGDFGVGARGWKGAFSCKRILASHLVINKIKGAYNDRGIRVAHTL